MEERRQVVLRGRLARPFAVGWFGLAAYLALDVVLRANGDLSWSALAALAFVSAVVYALSFRPAVSYDDERLLLRNIVRDIDLPWPRVAGLDWRYVLTVQTE